MSHASAHPAYLLIEDRLDAVGQKYRALRIIRGAMIWLAASAAASVAAGIAAHLAGAGRISQTLLAAWLGFLALSAIVWILRPLVMRPRPVDVARLVEGRLPGLHNGLTNSVMLHQAADLQDSPWLGPIYEEALALTQNRPVARPSPCAT